MHFGCHGAVYPREREREREREQNKITTQKQSIERKRHMHEKCINIWHAKYKSIMGTNPI